MNPTQKCQIGSNVLPFIFQGNYFLFIELASQLYRTLLPIPVWIFYLLDHKDNIPAKILGVILTAAYMVFKGKSIMTQVIACKNAGEKLFLSTVSLVLRKYHEKANNRLLSMISKECLILFSNFWSLFCR